MVRQKETSVIGVIRCENVDLGGPAAKPFFRARLLKSEAQALLDLLDDLSSRENRSWYFLTSSTPEPTRLRLVDLDRTPEYELAATRDYLRGELFRVTGREDSCNINFSGPVGAMLLADRMRSALARANSAIDIVIPNRHGKKDLVEFVADNDRSAAQSEEHDRLALAGESLASQTLATEDFSDWE